jgi:hypothetical protein
MVKPGVAHLRTLFAGLRDILPAVGGQVCFVRIHARGDSRCVIVRAMNQQVVDEVLAREVATAVLADVRTVRRVLRGQPVRGLVGARIRAELERRRRNASKPPEIPVK